MGVLRRRSRGGVEHGDDAGDCARVIRCVTVDAVVSFAWSGSATRLAQSTGGLEPDAKVGVLDERRDTAAARLDPELDEPA